MKNITTHSELVLHNLQKNLAPFPAVEDFQSWGKSAEDMARYKELHLFMKNFYITMRNNPSEYGFPQDTVTPDSTMAVKRQKAVTVIRNILSFLMGLGCVGRYVEETGELVVELEQWTNWCKDNKIKNAKKVQATLQNQGIAISESNSSIRLKYPANPQLLQALHEYTTEIQKKNSNAVFERCDFRVFSPKKWSFDKYDALSSLPEDKAAMLTKFIECIEGYKQKPQVKLTFLFRGFWACTYTDPATKKSTSGYWIENDDISLKVVFDDLSRILPFIENMPEDFQRTFLAGCPCFKCGKGNCTGYGLDYHRNGKSYLLCKQPWFLYENIQPEQLDNMILLLKKRMELLRECN